MRAQAPRQEGVQSGPRRCQYHLDSDKLACTNSAKAGCQESGPQFHVSQVDCVSPNGHRNGCFPEPSQKVFQIFERNGPQELTRKNKFCGTGVYIRSGECVLLVLFREASPKGLFCYVS